MVSCDRPNSYIKRESLYRREGSGQSAYATTWRFSERGSWPSNTAEAKVSQESIIPTGSQLDPMEETEQEKEAHGKIETEHPATWEPWTTAQWVPSRESARSTSSPSRGLRTCLQPGVHARHCADKGSITAANLLNDLEVGFLGEHGIELRRILTGRATDYCRKTENHAYQLCLEVEDIDHSCNQANSPKPTALVRRAMRPSGKSATACSFAKNCAALWRSCGSNWASSLAVKAGRGLTQGASARARFHRNLPAKPALSPGKRPESRA